MRFLIPVFISAFIFSCNSSSEDSSGVEEVSVEQSISFDDLVGEWKIAVHTQNGWMKVEGADSYSLNIISSSEEGGLGLISQPDRNGMSVWIHAVISEFSDLGERAFEISCQDESLDANYDFAGYKIMDEEWGFEVLVLEGEFGEVVAGEVMDEFDAVRLYPVGVEENFLDGVLTYEMDLGFDGEYGYLIPEEGLTEENLTEELATMLVSNYIAQGIMEGDYVSSVDYGNNFMLVHDRQDGDYSTLTFYSIDVHGNVNQEYALSGVFDWFEGNRKYVVEENNHILCKPGDWKLNEEEERMMLMTDDVRLWINEIGEIIVEK